MFESVKKDKFFYVIVYFALFFCSLYIFKGNVLNSDDIYFNFLNNIDIKLKYDFFYGSWIMSLQNLLMYYLPNKLGVNLQVWALSFGVFFEASIVTFMICSIMNFCDKNIRFSEKFLLVILTYFLYFILLGQRFFIDFLLYSGFFRFVLPSLFLVIVVYFIKKLYSGEKVNNLMLGIFSFLASSSLELVGFLLILISFFSFLAKFIFPISKDKYDFKFYLKWIFLIFANISGFLFLYFSEGFRNHLHEKSAKLITLDEFCDLFIPFCNCFYNEIILPYWYLFAFILLISFYLLKKDREKSFLVVSFSFIVIFSFICLCFSFIFLGKTSYKHNFWLDHFDNYSVFVPLLLFNLISLLSYFLSSISLYKKQISVLFILFLFSLSFPFFSYVDSLKKSIDTISKYTYIRDKIRLYYSYRGVQPYSSLYLLSRPAWIQTRFFPFEETDVVIHFAKVVLDDVYYPICYNHHIHTYKQDYIFLSFFELLAQFERDGGSLQEVLVSKYDFAKLSDKNFVLNKQY